MITEGKYRNTYTATASGKPVVGGVPAKVIEKIEV